MNYFLINNKIMKGKKMPLHVYSDHPNWYDSKMYLNSKDYLDWLSSLQPCEISESELDKVNKHLGYYYEYPIDVTNLIADNNGVITFKEKVGKQHIYDWEWYQPLFDLMLTHNVKLLEGEMDEIIDCVNKMNTTNRNI